MRPLLTGIAVGLAIILAVALGGYWWVGATVAEVLATRFDVPLVEVAVPRDSASRVEGERLAWFHGCYACHDTRLQGRVFINDPNVMRLVTPNIPEVIASYSDAELARLIRHGVRRDGTGVVSMPIAGYFHLSDADVGRLIAHLRAVPRVENTLPPTELHLLAKMAVLQGQLRPDAATLAHGAPRLGARGDTTEAFRGRYLALTICSECHGPTLHGRLEAPPLPRAMGYTPTQFASLLLDGRSRDGRDLPTMGRTARERFVRFNQPELAAIFGYLMVMPTTPPASRAAARAPQ